MHPLLTRPLTLLRSFTFWFGLLIIALTCGAWWDSHSHASDLHWKQLNASSGHRGITLRHHLSPASPGTLTFREPARLYPLDRINKRIPSPFLVQADFIDITGQTRPARTLQEAEQIAVNFEGPGSWSAYLPYWIITLVLLLIWSPLLILHTSRKTSTTQRAPEAKASPSRRRIHSSGANHDHDSDSDEDSRALAKVAAQVQRQQKQPPAPQTWLP